MREAKGIRRESRTGKGAKRVVALHFLVLREICGGLLLPRAISTVFEDV